LKKNEATFAATYLLFYFIFFLPEHYFSAAGSLLFLDWKIKKRRRRTRIATLFVFVLCVAGWPLRLFGRAK
jgi:hypothetical protein